MKQAERYLNEGLHPRVIVDVSFLTVSILYMEVATCVVLSATGLTGQEYSKTLVCPNPRKLLPHEQRVVAYPEALVVVSECVILDSALSLSSNQASILLYSINGQSLPLCDCSCRQILRG